MWGRLFAAFSLSILAPLVAEYLLGSLPVWMIFILPLMVMLYGSATVLIRELVRRTHKGWPSIALLAMTFGLFEEGFLTQSLFNPNYLHLRLLDFGYLPAIGTALPWLIFVVTLHVVWSVCVPIAFTEILFKNKKDVPWLGPVSLSIFVLLFLAGSALVAGFSYKQVPFMASPQQFLSVGAAAALLVVLALTWPSAAAPKPGKRAPHPVLLFAAAFIAGSALMLLRQLAQGHAQWSWQVCVLLVLGLEALFAAFLTLFGRGREWTNAQQFALMCGGLFVYVWIGFLIDLTLHGPADLPLHAAVAAILIVLCLLAGVRAVRRPQQAGSATTAPA
ncbi:MAG: hypothetical protein ACXU8U_02170 [Asticcacaulis sp.]